MGHFLVGVHHADDGAGDGLADFAVGELVDAGVVHGLEGDFGVFDYFVPDSFGVVDHVVVGEVVFEDHVELFDQFGEEDFFFAVGFTGALAGGGFEDFIAHGVEFERALFADFVDGVVGEFYHGEVDAAVFGDFGAEDFEHLLDDVFEEDVPLFDVAVVVGDDLGEEVVEVAEALQVLHEEAEAVHGFALFGIPGVPYFVAEPFEGRADQGGQAVLGEALVSGQEVGPDEVFDFRFVVDALGVKFELEVDDHLGVRSCREGTAPVVELEILEDLIRVVYKVQDDGPILSGVGAVEPGEGLDGGHTRELFVHVHGHQLGLIEAGLELVGYDEHLVFGAVEGVPDIFAPKVLVHVLFGQGEIAGLLVVDFP